MNATLIRVDMNLDTYKLVTNLLEQREKARIRSRDNYRRIHNTEGFGYKRKYIYFNPVGTLKYSYDDGCYKLVET